MAAKVTRLSATKSAPPPALAAGPAWTDVYLAGAQAWTDAFRSFADAYQTLGRAQVEMAQRMVSMWAGALPGGAGYQAVDELLREELLMAGAQGERFAEAAQQTLRDLDKRSGGPGFVPLPE